MLNNYVYSMKNAVKGGKSVSDINVFRLLISSGVCVCVCVCVCLCVCVCVVWVFVYAKAKACRKSCVYCTVTMLETPIKKEI